MSFALGERGIISVDFKDTIAFRWNFISWEGTLGARGAC